MPLPRGITLPSGSRPVYGLTRFDAPPSRTIRSSGILTWRARARLPLRGQHKNGQLRIEQTIQNPPHLFPDYPGPKISARAPGTAPPGVFEARGDTRF